MRRIIGIIGTGLFVVACGSDGAVTGSGGGTGGTGEGTGGSAGEGTGGSAGEGTGGSTGEGTGGKDGNGSGGSAAESCDDGVSNQDETDVDCGGSCDPCEIGKDCTEAEDCETASCGNDWMGMGGWGGAGGAGAQAGVCLAPSCNDGAENGDETDVDCGGETCAPCADLLGCSVDDDCDSMICGDMQTCVPPECGDEATNGTEECDSAGVDSAACDQDCSLAVCGDGHANSVAGEACDDGNTDLESCDYGDESCTVCNATCQEEAGTASYCGDSETDLANGEQCDDGNDVDDDACSNTCGWNYAAQCLEAYQVLDDPRRNVSFSSQSDNLYICDEAAASEGNPDWTGPGWYRFSGAAGTQMPVSAPAPYSCGTHAAGWMNGSHPTTAAGVVDMDVCFSWNSDDCWQTEPGRVVNCGDFYLYDLPKPTGCAYRHCGE